MVKKYIIGWKSIESGRNGLGKGLFTREEAERIAAELNEQYPDFEHFPVDSTTVSAPVSVIEMEDDKIKENAA